MAQPDPVAARVFEGQVSRHQAGARGEFANVKRNVESLTRDLEILDKSSTSIALGSAKNLARDVADLIAHLSALATLHDMKFLAKPDTEE
ncbi:hypothetical protein [Actinomadura rubrisoli]|uniref:Uncharacterized protein n=1 Tax=Actinomadura rubrisoli TaxID=2530368 RepID=A0A4R5CCJ1_9ACTN|nr:hypothetical protein [Actinomadura rubrisoli]TDD97718.1 hypothetical protein E1298_01390 [Actinomadura rubrisoli]